MCCCHHASSASPFSFSSSSLLLAFQTDRGRGTRRRTSRKSYGHAAAILLAALLCLTSCQTLRHRFLEPAPNWQSRIGQLQYRGPKTSLIGEVLVRYSTRGDFE